MNHVYRLTWNASQQSYVATAETARGRHKGGRTGRRARRTLLGAAVAVSLLGGNGALAAPTGGQISSGSASLTQNGTLLTVNQTSNTVALNWQSFNVAANETVNFIQPSATAVALNRVVGSDPSAIYGKLNANGQVFLINPNGILFGRGAEVNVGALVASTQNLSDADLAAGRRTFGIAGNSAASVINAGRIVADSGYIALLGAQVSNQGTLQANLGTVALAAGQQTTLDFAGDKLINVAVERGALAALAENRQLVQADGGTIILTAGAADSLLSAVVNNSGLIQAHTLSTHAGVISLIGDMRGGQVMVGGTLDASAPNGGDGGFVETSGATVKVADQARITTAAPQGRTGSWLIDPHDYTVAATGGDISGATLSASLANTSVTLQSSAGAGSGSGDVNVRDAVTWNADTTLTLTASNNVNVSAPISASGMSTGLVINPNSANGSDAASGTGSFNLQLGAAINLPNVAPTSRSALVIGGIPYTVLNSLGSAGDSNALTLQGIGGDLAGHYALGSDIDAAASATWNGRAGFAPLGNSGTAFTGTFDGLGHTIDGLTINRPAADNVGLFGQIDTSGVVRRVALAGGSVSGHSFVGPVAGWNDGLLSQTSASVAVIGSTSLGGLAGVNTGDIERAAASGAVAASGAEVGGLVGANYGTVSNAYALGAVSGSTSVGGLLGSNAGTLRATYATGSAAGASLVGGLVGFNTGSASTSYAIGTVSGSSNVGALVGRNVGSLSALYWNKDVRASGIGAGSAVGATGLGAAQMRVAANFVGFNFNAVTPDTPGWYVVDADSSINNAGGAAGSTTPLLSIEYATSIGNAHQLQLMAVAPAARYSLASNIDASASAGSKDVWGAAGFVPVGNLSVPFSGSLDGMNHTISGLTIKAPTRSYVGLFGNIGQGEVRNLGLLGGTVSGGQNTGAVAGKSDGTISNVYATGSVSGTNVVGGLVGYNTGTIADAYASGAVSGNALVGGLAGKNDGSASHVYASGAVSGTAAGGLVGSNAVGILDGAFWNSDSNASGVGSGLADGATGLSNAQMQAQANFSGSTIANNNSNPAWNFQATWLSYEGHTSPLLRSFLAPLTVTANAVFKNYDGMAYTPAGVRYSATPGAQLLGALTYGGSAQGAINAGAYTIEAAGFYSTQQGYAISYANAPLAIMPAVLTVQGTLAASKVYDGSTTAALSGGRLLGVIGGDSVTLNQAGVFYQKDVGAAVSVRATDMLGGSAAVNYVLIQPGGLSASITPKQLTIDGTVAVNKIYNGTREASLTGGTLSGLIDGDTVRLSQSGTFASKDAGSAIAVQSSAALSGRDAGNYSVLTLAGLSADITPRQLTVRGTVDGSKVYDGLAQTTINGGSVSGIVGGDSVSFLQTGSFADKNVGKAKQLVYTNSLTGADSANYALSASGGTTSGTIIARDISVQGTAAANKFYDGATTATMSATLSGLVAGDSASLVQVGKFSDKNVGVSKVVSYTNSLAGADAGNYKLASAGGVTTANVAAKVLTVDNSAVAIKVYDGSTRAVLSGGTLVGVIGGEAVRLRQAGAFVTKNSGKAVGVVTADTLSGAAARNYTLVQPTGLTGTITQKAISASAPAAVAKVYDATTGAELKTGRIGGVIVGDEVALVQTGKFVDKNAGNAKAVIYSNSLSGGDAANYKLKTTGGIVKAAITALQLDVGGFTTAADKVYDGTTAATVSGGLIDGVLIHDVVTFAQVGKFSSKNIGIQSVLYKNSIGGRDAANYTLSEKRGTTTAEITE